MPNLFIAESGPVAIALSLLRLSNFKGARAFTFAPAGDNADIFGDNETGKTTVLDGLCWLLWNRDSLGKTDFAIKPLENGVSASGVEVEVFAAFTVAGKEVTLQKTLTENWVKPRGTATKQFTGHTTVYKWNGVPIQEKEWKDRLTAAFGPEKQFRMLAEPGYFASTLSWQERRALLLDVCGDTQDDQVIDANSKLAPLPEAMGAHSFEDFRKILSSRRKDLNKELEGIPVRISEQRRTMPAASAVDLEKIEAIKSAKAQKEEERGRILAGGELAEKKKELAGAKTMVELARANATIAATSKAAPLRKAVEEATTAVDDAARRIRRNEEGKAELEQVLAQVKGTKQTLLATYKEIKARGFTFTGESVCAACGQALPAEKVEAARVRAEELFNSQKSRELEANMESGRAVAARITDLEAKIEACGAKAQELAEEAAKAESALETARAKVESHNPEEAPVPAELTARVLVLQDEVAALETGSNEPLAQVTADIVALFQELQTLEENKAKAAAAESAKARIAELERQEETLAAELEQVDRNVWLTEEFVRTKVELLGTRINAKFGIARFKLFNTLVNGGLEECCELTVNGVPYGSLNHASKVNVGLDVINTLADHFGLSVPVFVDFGESVTALLPTTGQRIRLVVSEADKSLRIVVHAAQAA